jgi:tRNA pseudouridine55 synthase
MPRAVEPRQRDGVLIVHKPVGPTSHDVVICARRSLGVSRIGHTGTLDPQAAGVLPLVIGQATRLAAHLTKSDKEYLATIRFGIETDTYDASGTTVGESGLAPSVADLNAVLHRFEGAITQRPPLYSAKLVGGERSYVRARSGKPVPPPAVSVMAHRLELLTYEEPRAIIRIRCSAGFYVRSLAHDLGHALGVGAILDGLERTEAAGFTLSQAVPFSTLVTAPRVELWSAVKPTETLLPDIPSASLTAEGVRWARHGRELGPDELSKPLPAIPDLVRMLAPDGRMIGLAERSKRPGFLHPAVVFS